MLRGRYEKLRSEYRQRFAPILGVKEGELLISPRWSSDPRDQEYRENEQMIRKDCTRTFSHLLFFKSSAVQDLIVRLLLVFAFSHPEIGYKQGMTDLLAVLLLCLYCDRWRLGETESSGIEEECCGGGFPRRTQDVLDEHLRFQSKVYRQEAEVLQRTLSHSQRKALAYFQVLTSSDYLEHDCFSLLEAVFIPLRGFYVSDNSDSTLESRMDRIILLVRNWDSALVSHLNVFFLNCNTTQILEIHPSMFLLRWIRLLFCREFALEDVLYLWDRLFLHALPDFPVVPYLCTSVLLGMRERVKHCESISMLLSTMQEGPKTLNINTVWELTMRLWQVA